MGDLEEATQAALGAAAHVTDADKGAVEALLVLARRIDQDEERWELALRWAEVLQHKPPAPDNVSVPTYLKYCESLGLTPAGRTKLGDKKAEAPRGKLALLQDGARGARTAAR